jgi:ectoine hydroxylase-related dioxygenase (phytanoyl-CoA dioxygenase family)
MLDQVAAQEAVSANGKSAPTTAERFFFDTYGYLMLENFLTADHVERLKAALQRTIERRRAEKSQGNPQTGMTQPKGEHSTRIFYILDDDPLFLDMLDWPPIMPYVTGLLNSKPHHHASDAIVEYSSDLNERVMGWHIDGHDRGYRNLGRPIPLLQLKIGYYLSDMTEPGQGNLAVVPGSHKSFVEPDPEQLKQGMFPGAVQLCAPAGSALLFHNALWHAGGPFTKPDGHRMILYYAYEHPWMVASQEHWGYPQAFYNRLPPERRKFFHGFVFDPPEPRWG